MVKLPDGFVQVNIKLETSKSVLQNTVKNKQVTITQRVVVKVHLSPLPQ